MADWEDQAACRPDRLGMTAREAADLFFADAEQGDPGGHAHRATAQAKATNGHRARLERALPSAPPSRSRRPRPRPRRPRRPRPPNHQEQPRMSRRAAQLHRATIHVVELAATIARDLPKATARADTGPGIRARSYDPNPQGRPFWCETHERDVPQCHHDGLDCTGVPQDIHDPTGEAVTQGATTQPDDLTRLHASIDKAYRHLHDARRLIDTLTTTPPPPKGCESCARHTDPDGGRYYSPVNVGKTEGTRVEVAGQPPILDKPMGLCRWCWDFTSKHRRLPTEGELRAHHDGRRVQPQADGADGPTRRPTPRKQRRKKGTMAWTGAKITDRIDVIDENA